MNRSRDPIAPYRRRLLGLSYRMLGSRADAEDVLQDAFIRFSGADRVQDVESYLTAIVTRLCLDRLKSARAKREIYVGPWLPDPVIDCDSLSPETATELAEDLTFAFMLALEQLTPAERAAFLLHDVFDLPFREIAAILGKTDATCRQLATRARRALRERPRPDAPGVEAHGPIFQAFLTALATGDLADLTILLRHDAVLLSDSGGFRPSALNPIYGPDRIARLLTKAAKKFGGPPPGSRSDVVHINRSMGLITRVGDEPLQTMSVSISEGLITAVYVVRNPEKLVWLKPRGAPASGFDRAGSCAMSD
ncbi:RNA polymerase sigma factor SigJ [Phenylobacterium sp. LjRoot225]|uniref:RNA polymerase sigma factor SigJ n=1 Tax=Phenylobacterium sp. LjRoot225 TaxID=3342285 RepID=UPI003ECEA82D